MVLKAIHKNTGDSHFKVEKLVVVTGNGSRIEAIVKQLIKDN